MSRDAADASPTVAPASSGACTRSRRRRARISSIQAFFMIPNIQLSSREPGRHCAARSERFSTATCTRSSASATLRVMTRAKRRSRGSRPASSARIASSGDVVLMT